MLRSMSLLAAIALTVAGAPSAEAADGARRQAPLLTKPVSFQGLSRDSTRQQVRARFPKARPDRTLCRNGETVVLTLMAETACETLQLAPYAMGATPFSASFEFLPAETLGAVVLEYGAADEKLATQAALSARFGELKNLLIAEYGQPTINSCAAPGASDSGRMCSSWMGEAGSISLYADGSRTDKAGDALSYASLKVVFRMLPTGGAGRR